MKNLIDNKTSRRSFFKNSALFGAVAGGTLLGSEAFDKMTEEEREKFNYEIQKPENAIYSAC